jgi:hypothetical protein
VPSGSDLYLAVDAVPLKPLLQMQMGMAQSKLPPEAQQYMEAVNLISAAELTLNLASAGPTSLIIHGNDDTATQQLELLVQGAIAKMQSSAETDPASSGDPIQQALARYRERVSRPFQPTRNGTALTCVQLDGQDPAQRQMMSVAVIGVLAALLLPAVQAAREAARRAQAQNAGQFEMPPDGSAPTSPESAPGTSAPEASRPSAGKSNEPSALPGGVFLPN